MSLLKTIWGYFSDTEAAPVRIDASTHTLQTIDYEHHEIHSGSHFFYCDYELDNASNVEIEFILTAPSTKQVHMTLGFSASDGATMELFKTPTTIVGGTDITAINNNGNSINSAGLKIQKDPTSIGSDGTRFAGFLAGGGKTAGVVNRCNELILDADGVYLVRITSLTVSNDIGWCAEFYEHTPKN